VATKANEPQRVLVDEDPSQEARQGVEKEDEYDRFHQEWLAEKSIENMFQHVQQK
jgi:hypothetical protein